MRILMVSDYGSSGGAAVYVNNLCNELQLLGHRVRFLSCDKYDGKVRMNTDAFKSVSGNIVSRSLKRLWNSESKRKMKEVIDHFSPELIHFHCVNAQVSSSVFWEIDAAIPIVMTVHDSTLNGPCDGDEEDLSQKLYGILSRGLIVNRLKRVSRFIAPSEFIRSKMNELGFDATIVRNGCGLKGRYKEVLSKEILYVGRVDADKGVEYAVMALMLIKKDEGIKLRIVGDGSELNELKRRVRDAGMEDVIFFEGFKKQEELSKYYIGCAAVIVPSVCEDNQPTSIIEAMHYGRAVIASDVGGIPEMVIQGKNGFLVRPKDYEGIKEAILEVLEYDNYLCMGKESFNLSEQYSMKNNAKKVEEVYYEATR